MIWIVAALAVLAGCGPAAAPNSNAKPLAEALDRRYEAEPASLRQIGAPIRSESEPHPHANGPGVPGAAPGPDSTRPDPMPLTVGPNGQLFVR